MHIKEVTELASVVEYLNRHQLNGRYMKATEHVRGGALSMVGFKKREPKHENIWQFRITQKYRAFCVWKGATLVVFKIDDHQ